MRRCVSDASTWAATESSQIRFVQLLCESGICFHFGHCPIRKPTHFRGITKVLWSNLAPQNRFISKKWNPCSPLCLKLGYRSRSLSMFITSTKPLVPVASQAIPSLHQTAGGFNQKQTHISFIFQHAAKLVGWPNMSQYVPFINYCHQIWVNSILGHGAYPAYP